MHQKLNFKNDYERYHAHVYYCEESKMVAKKLCQTSKNKFNLKVNEFHEKLVGPHPCWSCQITVEAKDFDDFIPWLEENRQELTIFFHAATGNNMKDHTELVAWLGQPVPLNLGFFETLNKK